MKSFFKPPCASIQAVSRPGRRPKRRRSAGQSGEMEAEEAFGGNTGFYCAEIWPSSTVQADWHGRLS